MTITCCIQNDKLAHKDEIMCLAETQEITHTCLNCKPRHNSSQYSI